VPIRALAAARPFALRALSATVADSLRPDISPVSAPAGTFKARVDAVRPFSETVAGPSANVRTDGLPCGRRLGMRSSTVPITVAVAAWSQLALTDSVPVAIRRLPFRRRLTARRLLTALSEHRGAPGGVVVGGVVIGGVVIGVVGVCVVVGGVVGGGVGLAAVVNVWSAPSTVPKSLFATTR
jgi:hypothetical protein